MRISEASEELFTKLKLYKEVVGLDITCINEVEYIVVFLQKKTKHILRKIPKVYKGNAVITEIVGTINLQ